MGKVDVNDQSNVSSQSCTAEQGWRWWRMSSELEGSKCRKQGERENNVGEE